MFLLQIVCIFSPAQAQRRPLFLRFYGLLCAYSIDVEDVG